MQEHRKRQISASQTSAALHAFLWVSRPLLMVQSRLALRRILLRGKASSRHGRAGISFGLPVMYGKIIGSVLMDLSFWNILEKLEINFFDPVKREDKSGYTVF